MSSWHRLPCPHVPLERCLVQGHRVHTSPSPAARVPFQTDRSPHRSTSGAAGRLAPVETPRAATIIHGIGTLVTPARVPAPVRGADLADVVEVQGAAIAIGPGGRIVAGGPPRGGRVGGAPGEGPPRDGAPGAPALPGPP